MVFLSPQVFFGQTSKKLEITSNIKGIKTDSKIDLNIIKSTRFKSNIFCVSIYNNRKRATIYSFNLTTKLSDSLFIHYKKKYKNFFKERILSITVLENYLVYVCNNNIYVFDISKSKKITFIGSTKNDYNFTSSFTLNNKVFLQVCYHFHPEDSPVNNAWALLNPKTLEIEKKKTLPDDDVIFGSFVNSWIDVQNSKIVYSRSSEYKITFHNDSFEQVDSIVSNELDKNKKFVETFKARDLFSKDAISKLHKEEDSLLTRIRKVYFLNDSCILVLLKLAGKNEIRADYWQKIDRNWQRIKQDLSSLWYEDGKMYSKTDLTYSDFYQNTYGLNYIGNFHFILTYYPFITSVKTEAFDINKDFYNKQNEALKNNENYIGIKEIQINSLVY